MTMMISKEERADLAMKDAIAWLDTQDVPYLFLPPYQIKIGPINFWPGRGTITVDGEVGKRQEKGLDGLRSLFLSVQTDPVRFQLQPSFIGLLRRGLKE